MTTTPAHSKIVLRGTHTDDVPEWFPPAANQMRKRSGLSLKALGEKLAQAAKRPRPWRHPSLIRFFNGSPTVEIANALCLVYPELPRWAFYPRDEREARAFERARQRHDALLVREQRKLKRDVERAIRSGGETEPHPTSSRRRVRC